MIIEERVNKDSIEHYNHSAWLRKQSFRVALIATFSALSVVLGYMLVYIPNIELFTLMIFLSGFVMGKRDGMIIGFLSSAIYTTLNPFGTSPLLLFAYQLLHYTLTGWSGGIIRSYLNKKEYFKPKADLYVLKILVIFGFTGAMLTFIYDILSTLFGGFIVSYTIEYFLVTYFSGLIFTTVHLIGNVLGFIFILPGLIQLILKLLD
jgi:uncharacterized membrane protein